MDSNTIPMVRAGPDVLRHGWHQASEDVRPVHEVQRLQLHNDKYNWESKMITTEQIYGKAAAMRLRTERVVLEQYKRMPGLESSRIGVETLLGDDSTIDFKDVLHNPQENMPLNFQIRDATEVEYAMF